MDKELERYIITGLVLILLILGLSGCAKPKVSTAPQDIPTVANLEGIADVLGCVFEPAQCQNKKDLGKTEEGK